MVWRFIFCKLQGFLRYFLYKTVLILMVLWYCGILTDDNYQIKSPISYIKDLPSEKMTRSCPNCNTLKICFYQDLNTADKCPGGKQWKWVLGQFLQILNFIKPCAIFFNFKFDPRILHLNSLDCKRKNVELLTCSCPLDPNQYFIKN